MKSTLSTQQVNKILKRLAMDVESGGPAAGQPDELDHFWEETLLTLRDVFDDGITPEDLRDICLGKFRRANTKVIYRLRKSINPWEQKYFNLLVKCSENLRSAHEFALLTEKYGNRKPAAPRREFF